MMGFMEQSGGNVAVKSRYEQLIAYIPITGIGHNISWRDKCLSGKHLTPGAARWAATKPWPWVKVLAEFGTPNDLGLLLSLKVPFYRSLNGQDYDAFFPLKIDLGLFRGKRDLHLTGSCSNYRPT
jgi:hypothetical protein